MEIGIFEEVREPLRNYRLRVLHLLGRINYKTHVQFTMAQVELVPLLVGDRAERWMHDASAVGLQSLDCQRVRKTLLSPTRGPLGRVRERRSHVLRDRIVAQ